MWCHRLPQLSVSLPAKRVANHRGQVCERPQDERVFEELLTTDKFFIYHSGDSEAMQAGSDQLKRVYAYFRKLDWQTWEPDDIASHKPFMLTIWEFQKVRGGDNKSLLSTL